MTKAKGNEEAVPHKVNRLQLLFNAEHEPYLYGVIHIVDGDIDNQWSESPFIISKRRAEGETFYGTIARTLTRITTQLARLEKFRAESGRELAAAGIKLVDDESLLPVSELTDRIMDEQEELVEDVLLSISVHVPVLSAQGLLSEQPLLRLPSVPRSAALQGLGDLFLVAPVNQNEQHPARPFTPIGPSMVGPALDHDAARSDLHLLVVQHQNDLTVDHDPVVDGLGAVHQRMLCPCPGRGCPGSANLIPRFLNAVYILSMKLGRLGRKVHEPDSRPVPGRRQDQRAGGRVGTVIDQCGRALCGPNLVKDKARKDVQFSYRWECAVGADDGIAVAVVTRDDAANRAWGLGGGHRRDYRRRPESGSPVSSLASPVRSFSARSSRA